MKTGIIVSKVYNKIKPILVVEDFETMKRYFVANPVKKEGDWRRTFFSKGEKVYFKVVQAQHDFFNYYDNLIYLLLEKESNLNINLYPVKGFEAYILPSCGQALDWSDDK
jgi:hypothetical protein